MLKPAWLKALIPLCCQTQCTIFSPNLIHPIHYTLMKTFDFLGSCDTFLCHFFPSPCLLFIILQLSDLLCHLYLLVLPVSCSMQTPVVTYVTVTAKSGSLPYTLLLTTEPVDVHWQFDVADQLLNSTSPPTPDISPVFSVSKWMAPPSLQVPKVSSWDWVFSQLSHPVTKSYSIS